MNTHADRTGQSETTPNADLSVAASARKAVPWKTDGFPSPAYATDDPAAPMRFLRRALTTSGFAILVYLVLLVAYLRFPYIGEGGRVVITEKMRHVTTTKIFAEAKAPVLVIFGNSKTLSGFHPETFDELSGGTVYSYNLGLPDADEFVDVLEALVRAGNIPSEILITILWADRPDDNPLVLIHGDKPIMEKLFPFRYIVRDLVVFLNRARFRGGFRALYETTRTESKNILGSRGYYFISGQSQYPNERLPDDFSYKTDTPGRLRRGHLPVENAIFGQLMAILETHHIKAYVVPTYHREGEFAPRPEVRKEILQAFENNPWIDVLPGPDYLLYPNRLFSDPLHLNREGARVYSQALYELLSRHKSGTPHETAPNPDAGVSGP